jgi:hypothetical protein
MYIKLRNVPFKSKLYDVFKTDTRFQVRTRSCYRLYSCTFRKRQHLPVYCPGISYEHGKNSPISMNRDHCHLVGKKNALFVIIYGVKLRAALSYTLEFFFHCIVQSVQWIYYGPDDRRNRVRLQTGTNYISFLRASRPALGTTYPMDMAR